MDTQLNDGNDAVQVLQNMESLIKANNATIAKNKDQLKKLKEMLSDIFTNDPVFQEHNKLAKEAAKIRQKTRSEIMKQPAAADLVGKIKELTLETKELTAGMSDYLREYQRLSGSNQIEDDQGNVMEIVFVAKLIRQSSKFR